MAKYERRLKGDVNDFLDYLDSNLMKSSASITYEDGSDISTGNSKLAVRVYERYSMMGNNRVSLNITVLSNDNDIFVSVISSGGSQAILFKINTIGEESFLSVCENIIEKYMGK